MTEMFNTQCLIELISMLNAQTCTTDIDVHTPLRIYI
jgi:hypothetical protein